MVQTEVIVLVGMPGAGKSTCVEHLVSRGYASVYFGHIVVEEAKRRYGSPTEKGEKIVREELREIDGKGAIAKRIIPKIDALLARGRLVVADGLYSWTEYKMFKQHYGDRVAVIAIAAPRQLRHARLLHRPIRPLSEHEVSTREYAEIENLEKGGPIANADYTLVNDSNDPNELLLSLDNLLADLKMYTKK